MTFYRLTRLNCWKTMPMRRRMSRSPSPDAEVISAPSQITLPEVGSIRRLIQRKSVDLPEPDRPITTRNSPSATVKLTSVNATVPLGYRLCRCWTSSMHRPQWFRSAPYSSRTTDPFGLSRRNSQSEGLMPLALICPPDRSAHQRCDVDPRGGQQDPEFVEEGILRFLEAVDGVQRLHGGRPPFPCGGGGRGRAAG